MDTHLPHTPDYHLGGTDVRDLFHGCTVLTHRTRSICIRGEDQDTFAHAIGVLRLYRFEHLFHRAERDHGNPHHRWLSAAALSALFPRFHPQPETTP